MSGTKYYNDVLKYLSNFLYTSFIRGHMSIFLNLRDEGYKIIKTTCYLLFLL